MRTLFLILLGLLTPITLRVLGLNCSHERITKRITTNDIDYWNIVRLCETSPASENIEIDDVMSQMNGVGLELLSDKELYNKC